MKGIIFKCLTFAAVALLFLNLTSISYANQFESTSLKMMDNLSNNEKQVITNHLNKFNAKKTAKDNIDLSKGNLQLANKSLENIEENIVYADIINGEKVILLDTEEKDIQIAITDDVLEIIERVDENIFLINGEENYFKISIHDETGDDTEFLDNVVNPLAFDGWVKTGQKPGPWTVTSSKTVNIQAKRNLSSYTASALTSVVATVVANKLGLKLGSSIVVGVSAGIAGTLVSSQYPTSIGKTKITSSKNGNPPIGDKRVESRDYAVYKGKDYYLGKDVTYYSRCIGCGV